MATPAKVLELVDLFSRHADAYRSAHYKETQVRLEFINPLFRCLGWDMENEQGYAEAYKDVIHEDAIKIGGVTKAPDYCFRIGGARKFFLEAKKPGANLKNDPTPAYQLRRYAWSAKLPLSILTDFEEFAVYDCRVKPAPTDKTAVARTLYLTCADYATRWDEIAAIFSREAILKGSFDKYAETTKVKRGTATVDAAFLQEIEEWRLRLAKNLALRNPKLGQRELNYAVQMTIDRIIFLRMCEDRGIESYGQLQALLNGPKVYGRLKQLFQAADDRYNSGLFHFHKEKDRTEPPDDLTPRLKIDDQPLKEIIKGLYYPESPYEFSVMPTEILGQVYEQFLGKVIRLTAGHQAKVEDKPEVKKAGGVYYTPAYIVDYIVKHTVGKLLGEPGASATGGKGLTPRQAARLRILDPACGSGSFLLGAYQYLLDWHRDYYVKDGPAKHTKELYQGPGGGWRLTTAEKKRILLNNIYGVDIDPQAVEVTKLSLLLRVLEGESQQTLERQLKLFHERALPDLAGNIKCGNSLIGPDFYDGQQMTMFDEEERYRINVFDWNEAFPWLEETGGFDAVIGNPPYGAYLHERDKEYLLSKYTHQTYQLDSYQLFLERALGVLLHQGGHYGMIIPNPWLTNLLQTKIRRLVTTNTRIHEIVHFRFPVFPKATVDTEIVLLERNDPTKWQPVVSVFENLESFCDVEIATGKTQLLHEQDKWRLLDGGVINIFMTPNEDALAAKCKKAGVPLESLCVINVGIKPYQVGKGKPPQTKKTVEERPYDSDRRLTPEYRRYLRGGDIGRYTIDPLEPRYLKYGPWLAEPRPAADFDAPEKILMRQTGDSLIATIDRDRHLCLNNMHVLVPAQETPALTYILGVLNSRLLNWYYQTLNPEKGEALAEVKRNNVAKLPISLPKPGDQSDNVHHDRMVELVEHLLALHQQLAAAKTPHDRTVLQGQIAATDRQIDRLVYELYRLTAEEIKLVEESS
jgi:hypothetical protein